MLTLNARRPIYLSEAALIFYWVAMSLLIVLFFDEIPGSREVLGVHVTSLVGFGVAILWSFRLPGRQQVAFRMGLVLVAIWVAFDQLAPIVPNVNPRRFDAALIHMDEWLFGVNPQLWVEQWYHPLFTEILAVAYASYYFLPFGLAVPLVLQRRYGDAEDLLTTIIVGFFLTYFLYMLVPARSPYVFRETAEGAALLPYTTELTGLLLTDPIRTFIHTMERIKFDAFPSGHTATSLIVLLFAWRMHRRVFWVLFIPVSLLLVSTVYLRYHYVIDVIAGAVLAAALVGVVPPAMRRWNERYGLPDDPSELDALAEGREQTR